MIQKYVVKRWSSSTAFELSIFDLFHSHCGLFTFPSHTRSLSIFLYCSFSKWYFDFTTNQSLPSPLYYTSFFLRDFHSYCQSSNIFVRMDCVRTIRFGSPLLTYSSFFRLQFYLDVSSNCLHSISAILLPKRHRVIIVSSYTLCIAAFYRKSWKPLITLTCIFIIEKLCCSLHYSLVFR